MVSDLAETVEDQQQRIDDLEEKVEDLENTVEDQENRIDDFETSVENQQERIEDLEAWVDRKDETIKALVADLNELEIDEDDDPADRRTDRGPAPASSPLDFFLNNQQYHVGQALSANRARAVQIVRRHEEFGRRKQTTSTYAGKSGADRSVVFTKDDVRDGLLAIRGKKPHNQTVERVWGYLREMAGDDADTYQFRDRTNGLRREGIKFDAETIDRFEEERYVGLDLLGDADDLDPEQLGAVTPVVIDAPA